VARRERKRIYFIRTNMSGDEEAAEDGDDSGERRRL
jgi:hypothetical protein